jgi:Pyruvate/2-oxoglutarate dehydrogenase complex, dihydrolipoamide acyltransferase (E2) component, and related enzymes
MSLKMVVLYKTNITTPDNDHTMCYSTIEILIISLFNLYCYKEGFLESNEGFKMDLTGKYIEETFSKSREIVIDVVELGLLKHHIEGSIEIDVTLAREYIQKYKEKTGNKISFTGWVTKCISQVVSENKQIQTIRKGKKKVIIFDDVDILVTVEKIQNEERIPLPYVIRRTNGKSLMDISNEIRTAQSLKVGNNTMVIGRSDHWLKLYQSVPKLFRKIIGYKVMRDPFFIKKTLVQWG